MLLIFLFISSAIAGGTNIDSANCIGDWNEWCPCTPDCGSGITKRTYHISSFRKGSGRDCDYDDGFEQSKMCSNPKPCFVGDTCMVKRWDNGRQAYQCIEVSETNADADLAPCTGIDGQLWRFEESGNFYRMQSALKINGQTACLMPIDDGQAQASWRRNVLAWACLDHEPLQQWSVSASLGSALNRGYIRNHGVDNSCLDYDESKGFANGKAFDVQSVIISTCNDQSALWIVDCNKDCVYGEWGEWSSCSKMCGGGTRKRTRQSVLSGLPGCDDTTREEACNGWPCVKADSCFVRPKFDPYHLKCLGFAEGDYHLVSRPCTGESRQLWSYDGQYLRSEMKINNQEVCLTVQANKRLRAWPCNNGVDDTQKFDRYFDQLVAFKEGLCVTIEHGVNWDLTTQDGILDVCTADDSQNFIFECVPSDLCKNKCPGTCACQLDGTLTPYCNCPGTQCDNLACFNGGEHYFDGASCHCRCPAGYFGEKCEGPKQCVYSEWSSWTICTKLCGGGKATRVRTALQFPELCLDLTDIGDCNIGPCVPVGGLPLPPGTDTAFGVQPFSACRMMPLDNPTQCLTANAAGKLEIAPCSSNTQGQAWDYDGKTNVNAKGKCLDIQGGIAGTNVIPWDCHGGANQQFTFGNRALKASDGRCLQYDTNGQVYVASCQNFKGWVTDCTSWPSSGTSGGSGGTGTPAAESPTPSPIPTQPSEGCTFEVGGSGRCLSLDGGNVVISPCTGSATQKWYVHAATGTLRSSFNGKCLDIEGGSGGYNIDVWDCNGQDNQKFAPTNGLIVNTRGQCVDVEGGLGGTNVIIWRCTNGLNQQWKMTCGATAPVCDYGEWSAWTGCTKDCGEGRQFRIRYISSDQMAHCTDFVEVGTCQQQPCLPDCTYSAWTDWTPCSASCDSGFTKRFRTATASKASKPCDPTAEVNLCNTVPCKAPPTTSPAPKQSPNPGQQQPIDQTPQNPGQNPGQQNPGQQNPGQQNPGQQNPGQQNPGQQNPGQQNPIDQIPQKPIIPSPSPAGGKPTECVMGDWESWSACTKTCGLGKRNRKQPVVVPPRNGAPDCSPNEQWQYCNPQAC